MLCEEFTERQSASEVEIARLGALIHTQVRSSENHCAVLSVRVDADRAFWKSLAVDSRELFAVVYEQWVVGRHASFSFPFQDVQLRVEYDVGEILRTNIHRCSVAFRGAWAASCKG